MEYFGIGLSKWIKLADLDLLLEEDFEFARNIEILKSIIYCRN